MRILVVAVVLLGLAAGCSQPTAPEDGSPAADVGSDQGTAPAPGPTAEAAVAGGESEEATADVSFGVGDPAPAFEGLIGIDDQSHALADYADAKAVALVFTCNHCPVAVAYEDRLVALHKDYADKGVQLLAVNVNNLEADKLPAMKERAAEKGFEFPYLYDSTQQIGRDYGAAVTPHVFLLDDQRQLAYVGAIDDNLTEEELTEHSLRDAIDALLAGNAPAQAETKAFGCSIKYE